MKLWNARSAPLVTESSQAATFSRRAFVLGAAQAGVATLLAGRMGYIAIAENQRYSAMAEENRVQMRLIPPRRGWIVDRYGNPIAINRGDVRIDIIPDLLQDKERVIAELPRIARSAARGGAADPRGDRRLVGLPAGAGRRACPARANISRSRCASPSCPASPRCAPSPVTIPKAPAVGHLVGYVGVPNREEYEAEDHNPLLITPGFKVGKEGLEKMLEPRLRGRPGAARIEVTARGRLVRELQTLPDMRGAAAPDHDRRRPAKLCRAARRRAIGGGAW